MLQVTQAPQGPVLVKQQVPLSGIASTDYAGKMLTITIDGKYKTNGPVVNADGTWECLFVFNQAGNRRFKVEVGGESAEIPITVVAEASQIKRVRFTTVPSRLEAKQSGVIEGEAENYPDGSQLLLRADGQYELARPAVQDGRWQATIGFFQPGKRTIEILGTGQDRATTEIEVVAAPSRQPRVSFTNPPKQVKVEDSITLTGTAENYSDGAQLVLRADQKFELARPRVQDGKWQAETGFRQPGNRLIEIIGSDQDKAQITLAVQAPPPPAFQVLSRSTWTSNPTPTSLPNLQPRRITIHHTATSGAPSPSATQSQEAARMRAIRDIHLARPYADLGYHFIIMPSGRVYEGRSERKVGAHDVINDGLGIAFDGIYTSATINQQQFQTAVALCTMLCRRYGFTDPVTPVPTPTDFNPSVRNIPLICGHRDRVATECPGNEAGRNVRLPDIRQAVKAQL